MIGLRSNNSGISAGPYQFPVGAKVCNTSGGPLTGVQTSFNWTSSNTYVSLQPGQASTDTIGNLANGACIDSYYLVEVQKTSAAWNTVRGYEINATSTEGSTGSSPTPRQLYVELLVAQNRNTTQAISGPGGCNADFSVCDPAPTNLVVGQTYTYKLYAQTSTAYEQLEAFVTFPGSIFQVQGATSTYETPAGLSTNALYANACGWDAVPTSPDYKSCTGPIPPDFQPGGKAGGRTVVTYTVKVRQPGTGSLNSLIYDFSGSSYHYNSDYGTSGFSINITSQWPLDATVTGDGNVSSSPTGINCGAGQTDCADSYANNTLVTLTATPSGGRTFNGWGGACASAGTNSTCTVTMDQARSVTASFSGPSNLPLDVSVSGQGGVTSSPSGINCGVVVGTTSCAAAYVYESGVIPAEVVTLTAGPVPGNQFLPGSSICPGTGWTQVGTTADYTCVVTMDQARSATAVFEPVAVTYYPLDVTKQGSGTGTVTSTSTPTFPTQIDCGLACQVSYPNATQVTLTATPDPGTRFVGWGGACASAGTSSTCTVTMSQARSATAQFVRVYDLDVTKTGAGSGSVSSAPAGVDCGSTCAGTYDDGTQVTLTATPAPGSAFVAWGGACAGVGTQPPSPAPYTCTVTMSQARSVTAEFSVAPNYSLEVNKTGDGSGKVSSSPSGVNCGSTCTGTYSGGTSVTLTAKPDPGSKFVSWGGACAGVGTQPPSPAPYTCTVTMDQAKTVTAKFTELEPNLNLEVNSETKKITNGENVKFEVKISNKGPGTARNVRVCMKIPSGFAVVSTDGGKVSNGSICWPKISSMKGGKKKTYRPVLRAVNAPRSTRVSASASGGSKAKAASRTKLKVRPKPEPAPAPPTG